MFEDVIVELNPHWNGDLYEIGVKRTCFSKLLEYLQTEQVIAVTGVRRAGKSTLLHHLMNFLIQDEKIKAKNILFFNLEHPYLSPYRDDPTTLQRLYEDYLKLMQPKGEVFILLDEVQFFREWPVFVKALHERKKARFVVTGSNAAMLSTDMVTLLSGRSLALKVFPFSLLELISGKGINIHDPLALRKHSAEIKHALDELLEYGGFPTVALRTRTQTAFEILGAHARTVLLQDVVPRLGIRKPADLEKLYVYLVSNISKLFSYSNLGKLFGLSDKSIKDYLQALVDAHLVYEVDQFSYSLKKQIRNPKKIYAIDTGQANAMGFKFSENKGRLFENLIFIDLKRLDLEIYYHTGSRGSEVDFVVKKGNEINLVQVTWDLNNQETRQREIRFLKKGMEELECKTATLIVVEPLLFKPPDDLNITILPAYHYLTLEDSEKRKILGF